MFTKVVVVVDHDVNVQDSREVVWKALCAIDPERDIQFVLGPVDTLDHAARRQDFGSKMGIDATRKWPEEGFSRALARRNQNGCCHETAHRLHLAPARDGYRQKESVSRSTLPQAAYRPANFSRDLRPSCTSRAGFYQKHTQATCWLTLCAGGCNKRIKGSVPGLSVLSVPAFAG